MKISYECSDIIKELKSDILEFGEYEKCWGIIIKRQVKIPFTNKSKDVNILVNYLVGEEPPTNKELEGGTAILSTLGELLTIFEKQNKIV